MSDLPSPEYVVRDPAALVEELKADWEALANKPLYPAQVEQLFLNNMGYRESQWLVRVQEASKQNLVRFAKGAMLDYLGELKEAPRLPLQPARTRLQFSVSEALTQDLTIQADTAVQTSDGRVTFVTEADVTLPAGALSVETDAQNADAGASANGYAIGTVTELMNPVDGLSVTNLTVTDGGVDAEIDARYRARLIAAPAGFAVAGPEDAYKFLVKSAHQSICDVAVLSPAGAEIDVYVLTENGAPDEDVLDLVRAKLSDKKVRPLSELVRVHAAPVQEYAIVAELILLEGVDEDAILTAAGAKLDAMLTGTVDAPGRELSLGIDIVRRQYEKALLVPGVYDVNLISPAANVVVNDEVWAHCTSITLTAAGATHG